MTMFSQRHISILLLAGVVAVPAAFGQTERHGTHGTEGSGAKAPAAATVSAAKAGKASPYHPAKLPTRAKDYYVSVWGVDNFLVRETASGNLIRFSYRVVDPHRAEMLGDARATPHLIAPARNVVLQVPAMENIGDLRQKGKPVAGKEYWMAFSNKGNVVKPGDRVIVVIGSFHADGLRVE
jgi:hypothetical protein